MALAECCQKASTCSAHHSLHHARLRPMGSSILVLFQQIKFLQSNSPPSKLRAERTIACRSYKFLYAERETRSVMQGQLMLQAQHM